MTILIVIAVVVVIAGLLFFAGRQDAPRTEPDGYVSDAAIATADRLRHRARGGMAGGMAAFAISAKEREIRAALEEDLDAQD